MPTTYTLNFINYSTNSWDFCCYQDDPGTNMPDVMSLAWFAFPVAPTTTVSFSWQIDYQLIWSHKGKLDPGVIFDASQRWSVDPYEKNTVDFLRDSNRAFTFSNKRKALKEGTMYIIQNASFGPREASVGLNMGIVGSHPGAGGGTFAVPSQPNVTASFAPHPKYWVTFGSYQPGEILDIGQITDTAEVMFPIGITEMYAVLNAMNAWEILTEETLRAKIAANELTPPAIVTQT